MDAANEALHRTCTLAQGLLQPGPAAGPPVAPPPAFPGPSPRDVLSTTLPLARPPWIVDWGAAAGQHLFPASVQCWSRVEPEGPEGGKELADAIASFVAERCPNTVGGLWRPDDEYSGMYNVAEISSSVWVRLCQGVLSRLARSSSELPPGTKARWRLGPLSTALLECALLQEGGPRGIAAEVAQPDVDTVAAAAAAADSGGGSGSGGACAYDIVLVVEEQAREGRQQQQGTRGEVAEGGATVVGMQGSNPGGEDGPGGQGAVASLQTEKRQRVACVGKVGEIPQLMVEYDQPVDLVSAFSRVGDPKHGDARALLGQLYTHLLLHRACHGFITCWNATWLVHVPPHAARRDCMYISEPVLASDAGGSGADSGRLRATLLQALAWQQHQALLFAASEQRADLGPSGQGAGLCGAAGGHGACGGGGNGGSGSEGAGRCRDSGVGSEPAAQLRNNSDPSCTGSTSPDEAARSCGLRLLPSTGQGRSAAAAALEPAGAGAGGGVAATLEPVVPEAGVPGPSAAPGVAAVAPQLPHTSVVQLQFLAALGHGRDGTVFRGTCGGQPAIIKVYTWEDHQLAAYYREALAYQALEALQGKVVPKVLAHGRMKGGLASLRYLAMRPVRGGVPLSDHPRPFPDEVARAAVRALAVVHRGVPGLLHGDVRLENVLLVSGMEARPVGGAASSAGQPAGGPAASGEAAGDVAPSRDDDGAGGTVGSRCRCVVIDFGGSRFGGTGRQQKEERSALRRLLGMEGRG